MIEFNIECHAFKAYFAPLRDQFLKYDFKEMHRVENREIYDYYDGSQMTCFIGEDNMTYSIVFKDESGNEMGIFNKDKYDN